MKPVDADAINIRADLRSAWSSVRDQGRRSSCLACATSDAHAHSRNREALSAEFLFFHGAKRMPSKSFVQGLTFEAVDTALSTEGQPDETDWPYSKVQPNPWIPPAVSQRWYGRLNATTNDVSSITHKLESGRPVVLGVKLTPQFVGPLPAPYIVPAAGTGIGGHAVLAVGLGDHAAHGPLILFRNSWGSRWGDFGYAWLCAKYLEDKLIGYRVVQSISQSS